MLDSSRSRSVLLSDPEAPAKAIPTNPVVPSDRREQWEDREISAQAYSLCVRLE